MYHTSSLVQQKPLKLITLTLLCSKHILTILYTNCITRTNLALSCIYELLLLSEDTITPLKLKKKKKLQINIIIIICFTVARNCLKTHCVFNFYKKFSGLLCVRLSCYWFKKKTEGKKRISKKDFVKTVT